MLIKCDECNSLVSDRAAACPNCGYPLQESGITPAKENILTREAENPTAPKRRAARTVKPMRLPNGFGQISMIKGRNLRNPYRVMISAGRDENGRPVSRVLKPQGYFPTYNDAYAALLAYNRNPHEQTVSITVKELFDEWSDIYSRKLKSESSVRCIQTAWLYCSDIYDLRVKDLRARHIKACMDNSSIVVGGRPRTPSASMKNKIKSMFNLMLDYAYEFEYVERNYARSFKLNDDTIRAITTVSKDHIPFTDSEMDKLWAHVGCKYGVDLVLIQCYSGWRPQELGLIELDNVDLHKCLFNGGMKTEAGINRTVPIHSRILPFVEARYKEAVSLGSKFLFNFTEPARKNDTVSLTYNRYAALFGKIRDELGLDARHRPHDGRKHFVTKAKEYNVDEYAIKYMVGHKILDITEKVYTQRKVSWLSKEIEKIK